MRRFLHALCTLAAVSLLGCSLFNGKEGFLDRAEDKDVKENLMIKQCSDAIRRKYCVPDKNAPECRKYCG